VLAVAVPVALLVLGEGDGDGDELEAVGFWPLPVAVCVGAPCAVGVAGIAGARRPRVAGGT
jgi:hypothetical protein